LFFAYPGADKMSKAGRQAFSDAIHDVRLVKNSQQWTKTFGGGSPSSCECNSQLPMMFTESLFQRWDFFITLMMWLPWELKFTRFECFY